MAYDLLQEVSLDGLVHETAARIETDALMLIQDGRTLEGIGVALLAVSFRLSVLTDAVHPGGSE